MGRVVHFEVAADDVARAKEFYAVLGWEFSDMSAPGMEYWLAKTGEASPGIDGAITPRYEGAPPVRITIDVDDLDAMIAKVQAAGGKVEGEKMPIPGVGDYINATDTEGNQFGMLQAEPMST